MSGNSSSGGSAGGFTGGPVGDFLSTSRPLFDDDSSSNAEVRELEHLVAKYPEKARSFLDGLGFLDGSGSPP